MIIRTTYHPVDFAVSADYRIKIEIESEVIEKYQNLAREQKKW